MDFITMITTADIIEMKTEIKSQSIFVCATHMTNMNVAAIAQVGRTMNMTKMKNKQKGYINLNGLVWLIYFGFVGIILTALLLGYGAYWLFTHLVLTIV